MKLLKPIVLIALLLAANLATAASGIPAVPFEKYTLPNGLQVILHVDHSTPIVSVNVWYHVGSKNERPGRTGFAHLFEHMMFQGSKHHDTDYFAPLQEAGGNINGSTNQDRTNYFETVPANYLELALWMEADRMGFLLPAMSQEKLDNQRDVVKNERRQSYENRPYGLVQETILAAIYPAEHPYSWPTIGSMADIDNASREDVAGFFRRYYHPANASLCIAGDFDPAVAKRLVAKYFGPIPAGPKVEKISPMPARLKEAKRIRMADRVGLPRLYLAWPTVPYFAPDEPALDVLADVLTAGKTSRLEKTLVREKQLAQEVMAGQMSQEIAGMFMIVATARPGHTLEELEAAILDEIRRVQQQPPTGEEVTRTVNRLETQLIRSLETVHGHGGRADTLNLYNVLTGDPGYQSKEFERYLKVTPTDVQRAAEKYLGPVYLALEVVPGKETKIEPDLRIALAEQQAKLAAGGTEPASPPETDVADQSPWKALPSPGPTPKLNLPPFHREKLSNGMELLVVEKHALPTVALNLVFPVGRTAEPPSKLGLAGLTAAVWDEGTKTRTAEQIADELAGLGASLSCSTDWNTSAVRLFTLKRHLPAALAVYADVLRNPVFPERELAREKNILLGRLIQARNEPTILAMLAVGPTLYGPDHPYGQPPFGTPKTLASLAQADLADFYRGHFRPEQATLIAVGDVTPAELTAELEKALGGWKSEAADLPQEQLPPLPAPKPTRIVLVDKPGSAQSVITVAQVGPQRTSPDYYALSVMNTLFGGQFMSRLNMNLREAKGYTYGARSTFDWRIRQPGPFLAYSSVQTAVTAPALTEFLKEYRGITGAQPVQPAELDFGKAYLVRAFPADFETSGQIAGHLETLVEFRLPDDYFNAYIPRIDAVTADDVIDAAKKHIDLDRQAIIIVADRENVEPELRKLPAGKNLEAVRFDDNFRLVPAGNLKGNAP
ncbi:MAG: insulinase family protein [Pirellulales bacterium]|nr:insulinase family protein [Pirellulales bacterium]